MKTQAVAIAARQYDEELEKIIHEKNAELNDLAKREAQHYAKRNQPKALGDKLEPYVTVIKAGYEKLGATIFHHLQPEAHFPEANWDSEYFKNKDEEAEKQIQKKEREKHNIEHKLGNYDPKIMHKRILWALIITGIISIGDTFFNTKSFQVIGDNLLFAFIISICVSAAVFFFSHFIPFRYKEAITRIKKKMIVIGTLAIATALFTAIAFLRAAYLASHDVQISPVFFVIINLFLFIVSTLVSHYMLPTIREIKTNSERMKQHKSICAMQTEIDNLKENKEQLVKESLENKKQRTRIIYNANYALDIVRKMHCESVAYFKSENLINRTDGEIPSCFSNEIPELDINEITILKKYNKAS